MEKIYEMKREQLNKLTKRQLIEEVAQFEILIKYMVKENVKDIANNKSVLKSLEYQAQQWREEVNPRANMRNQKWQLVDAVIIAENIYRQYKFQLDEVLKGKIEC